MWLIDVDTLELCEFIGTQIPPYTILSHRWESAKDEMTFKDALKGRRHDSIGWQKVKQFADFVRKDMSNNTCESGYARTRKAEWLIAEGDVLAPVQYIWVDTCCIDKRSSAELSEAINSMWRWYKSARMCYVYLKDVVMGQSADMEQAICNSEWFTRSWTLQELIAPHNLYFVDQDWTTILGSKEDLQEMLSKKTGIDRLCLWSQAWDGPGGHLDTAKKLSWASQRHCTREEDRTYSLLGLFGVNMPLLYGEGERNAFMRFQQELLRISTDESIFAWTPIDEKPDTMGMLAPSLDCFASSGNCLSPSFSYDRKEYRMTNRGLKINGNLNHTKKWTVPDKYFLTFPMRYYGLDCFESSQGDMYRFLVLLCECSPSNYLRYAPTDLRSQVQIREFLELGIEETAIVQRAETFFVGQFTTVEYLAALDSYGFGAAGLSRD